MTEASLTLFSINNGGLAAAVVAVIIAAVITAATEDDDEDKDYPKARVTTKAISTHNFTPFRCCAQHLNLDFLELSAQFQVTRSSSEIFYARDGVMVTDFFIYF